MHRKVFADRSRPKEDMSHIMGLLEAGVTFSNSHQSLTDSCLNEILACLSPVYLKLNLYFIFRLVHYSIQNNTVCCSFPVDTVW